MFGRYRIIGEQGIEGRRERDGARADQQADDAKHDQNGCRQGKQREALQPQAERCSHHKAGEPPAVPRAGCPAGSAPGWLHDLRDHTRALPLDPVANRIDPGSCRSRDNRENACGIQRPSAPRRRCRCNPARPAGFRSPGQSVAVGYNHLRPSFRPWVSCQVIETSPALPIN